MALISLRDVGWGFGDPPLLENITLRIEKGERIGLLGRNGVGKSTLLKILSAEIQPDRGDIWRQQNLTLASVEQDVPHGIEGTIFQVVAQGLGAMGRVLARHHTICGQMETSSDSNLVRQRDELQHLLDTQGGWSLIRLVENVLSRTGLDPQKEFARLSAGMKRRTLFARAMVREPDLLLLDEPTNHLDIDTIVWMEAYILRHVKTLLFITHDRAFLERIATRVLDLDRGRLASYGCDYATYLKRRAADMEAEDQQNHRFDKKLSREEVWIRKGIKARRSRNEGRVRALEKMRATARARRKKIGQVSMQLQEAQRSGKLVIKADRIKYSYEQTLVIDDFSTTIMRGDKVGIIGPNGVGKSTLLNILLGDLPPDSGTIRHGTRLQVAFFDQLRSQLDEQRSVVENIGEGNDFILFNGEKRHVVSHLQNFLFSPERCRTPVHVLSGGERNRLLLARLFTHPANLLVLDEPTNDLDAETLELLEELLFEYRGTLLLVSHDRAFLNNVVTSTIVFEGRGRVVEYVGGYDDWLSQRPQSEEKIAVSKKETAGARAPKALIKPGKLSYMQARELKQLPQKIDTLESEQAALHNTLSDPDFYKKEKEEIVALHKRLTQVGDEIEAAYERWEELDNSGSHS